MNTIQSEGPIDVYKRQGLDDIQPLFLLICTYTFGATFFNAFFLWSHTNSLALLNRFFYIHMNPHSYSSSMIYMYALNV